jgi:hypothetical protein
VFSLLHSSFAHLLIDIRLRFTTEVPYRFAEKVRLSRLLKNGQMHGARLIFLPLGAGNREEYGVLARTPQRGTVSATPQMDVFQQPVSHCQS